MKSVSVHDPRPRLLMLSDCVPQPHGSPERMRAWRLLDAARRHHHVHLVTVADGAVNLTDWQRLSNRTSAHALLPQRRPRAMRRQFRETLAPWRITVSFDAVLCVGAMTWPHARTIDAPVHLDAEDEPAALRFLLTTPASQQTIRRAA